MMNEIFKRDKKNLKYFETMSYSNNRNYRKNNSISTFRKKESRDGNLFFQKK